ncbi:uncharacterized protein LOC131630180 [Vicia villosa]|uniref:uncharacterized protein LOC131630180 n=1 Tax=Vicia villosa TaxID=3911 RepID=UPI00273B1D0C|nr:uncharacterized protein LOC131630180 [Vicia villosa]
MGVFGVVFHHGGHFVQEGHMYYRGGSDTIVEGQDEDKWSFFEAVSLVRDWGYEGFRLWRKIPQLDEGFMNVVDDAACVEIAKHCMACKVDGHIWVEHGVKDMMTKVVHPNVDDFSTSSETESSGSDTDAGECFDDSEEERVIEVEDEQFDQVEVVLPESGNRVNVHGKSLRFERCASKDPKNMKAKSMVKKVNLLVPKSVLGSSSKRNTTNDEDVDYASEELDSSDADESDMGEKPSKPKYDKFRSELLNKDFQFKLGMEFKSLSEFKDAIREWSVLNGREISFVKNESYRVRVECKGKCGFLALCSKVGDSHTYQIKTWVGTHTCARVLNNKSANSKWVSKLVVEKRKSQGKVKLSEIMAELRQKYAVGITKGKAWRAKAIADEIIEGDAKEQYNMLWSYAAELRNHCAGNTVKINTERPHPTLPPRFGRFYFCLDGCKKGFTHGCRPFIGVDGCHLKTQYGGQLLIAVARDPNDQYYPLAFGVVETETKESWRWFMQLLMEDIGSERKYVFISDQQKGLVSVFEEMFEQIEHRVCLRHLYANFKKKFGGGAAIRDLLMGAAKATYFQAWEKKMNELKQLDKKAWDWLMGVPTKLWCKHSFSFYPKCDVLMNKWKHNVMPNPRKRLDKETHFSGEWLPTWSSGDLWQVHHPYNGLQFVVDIGKKSCTCCFWDLVGIPCRHAVSALQYQNLDPEKYVDPCYMRDAYRACYENNVSPINGMDMWPTVDAENLLPPQYKKGPGRPKKLRFRELDESGSRMRRVGVSYRCTKCDKLGHNSRKCQATEQNPNALKRKRKTPRTKVSRKHVQEPAPTEAAPTEAAPTEAAPTEAQTEAVPSVIEDPELDALLNDMMSLFEEQTSQVDNPHNLLLCNLLLQQVFL